MRYDDEDELPPAERAQLERLPREDDLAPSEEDRVVRVLRAHGFLPSGAVPDRRQVRAVTLHYLRTVSTIAAAVALFASGVAFGAHLESRRGIEALLAVRDQDARHTAALVQRAGSAYVIALARLASADSAPSAEALQGREAAQATLRAAAASFARLGLGGAVAERIHLALGTAASRCASGEAKGNDLIWF
ncbi:MAG: hypothetical protein WKG32_05425 [Gemmatimonadaceae bacterium]